MKKDRTIDKLLKYKLSKKEKEILINKRVSNGCGGRGGVNFSNIFDKLELRIIKLPFVNGNKLKSLRSDIHDLCSYSHDIDFELGGGFFNFIGANFDFSYKVTKLLRWTSKTAKIGVFFTLFMGLNIFGRRYFKWGKKKVIIHGIIIRKKNKNML